MSSTKELEIVTTENGNGNGEVLGNGNGYSKVAMSPSRSSMFDQREGQDLEWSDINYTVMKGEKQILYDSWGKVESGQICAIMGPSGSGKSSLLNVLAGRSSSSGDTKISGKVLVQGSQVDPVVFRKNIAYVMQDDGLMATATPRECLRFSATLRLGNVTQEDIEGIVTQTLSALSLNDCADTYVGNELIKGISGGQRKRTSVGVELVTKPSIVLLDEPTSGLDSYTAYSLVKLLKKVAASNATVLFTIHQPSSEVYHLFDHVVFLTEGKIFYQGEAKNLISYMDKFSYHCPVNYNPADYAMFIIQTESLETLENKKILNAQKPAASNQAGEEIQVSKPKECSLAQFNSHEFFKQIYYLFLRELTNTYRNIPALVGRYAVTTVLSLLFGLIFLDAGRRGNDDPDDFSSHFGAVTMNAIASMFGTAQPALLEFPYERPLFMREYSTGTYSAFTYFTSKVLIEIPVTFVQTLLQFVIVYWMIGLQGNFILYVLASWGCGIASAALGSLLGCLVTDPKQAMEMAPLLFVPQILFSGFFIRTELIPVWLRWAQYLCSLKYGLNLILINEFAPWRESCHGEPAATNCAAVLENNDVDPEYWWVYVIILIGGLFLTVKVLGAIILARNSLRFY